MARAAVWFLLVQTAHRAYDHRRVGREALFPALGWPTTQLRTLAG